MLPVLSKRLLPQEAAVPALPGALLRRGRLLPEAAAESLSLEILRPRLLLPEEVSGPAAVRPTLVFVPAGWELLENKTVGSLVVHCRSSVA